MLRFHRLVLATATFVAGAALSASPAAAYARPVAAAFPDAIQTQHFLLHYNGDGADHVLHSQVADLASLAENAYAAETGWGFPAPPNDGDGLIDVYITAQPQGVAGSAWPDDEASPSTTTGWVEIDPAYVENQHVIAHELFHLIQFGIWLPTDRWAMEATAEWAGFRVDGYSMALNGLEVPPPDMSLNCIQYDNACAENGLDLGGYTRWTFWEYLSEKYGPTFVRDVFQTLAVSGGGPALAAVSTLLLQRSTTLGQVFQDYTVADMTGNWPVAALQAPQPSATFNPDPIATGTATAVLPVERVAVNHLAARYLSFARGDGSGADNRCYAATLTLTVAIPLGLTVTPYFYWSAPGSTAQPLSVNGSTATITLPWDTCNWAQDPPYTSLGYLALPNTTQTADAQVFTVSGTLTVDTKTLASPDTPPTVPNVRGQVVDAPPDSDVAPSIFVYAPAVMPLSKTAKELRVVVFSGGDGKLDAVVGGVDLGAAVLRAGNNDLHFKLAAAAKRMLAARGSAVLSLTSLSPTGVTGTTVTRKLKLTSRHR